MRDLKQNPFALLGISSDSDFAHIKQVAQRLIMQERLGDDPDTNAIHQIENALEVLQDPVQRFAWGLFWPILTPAQEEHFRASPVLSMIRADPRQDLFTTYKATFKEEADEVRAHNLGVLLLLQAVVATDHAQTETPDDIDDDLACARLWQIAFHYLSRVLEVDRFWMRRKLWAKSLDDRRLDAQRVEQIRAGLLSEILQPVGQVITRALLDGHAKVAQVYVKLLRSSEFDHDYIEETLSNVYKPLADRVERNVTTLREELNNISPDTEDPSEFRSLLSRFTTAAFGDLAVMLDVGDLPGYAEEHARDTAAEFLRSLSIASWNQANDGGVAKEAAALASRIVDSDSLKSQISRDLERLEHLESEHALEAKLAPLWEEFGRAGKAGQYKHALGVLDAIIAESSPSSRAELLALRKRVSTAIATDLFNRSITRMREGDASAARELLSEALNYETDDRERRIIQDALARIKQPATGCLIPFVTMGLLFGAGASAGGILIAHVL